MREIAFDTETTGLDPNTGHKVIEIGCVELIDKMRTGNNFHAYINPLRDVPKSSTDVHGLTESFLADKPIFSDVAKDFLDFIGTDKLVIHNAGFDLKFINFELEVCKLPVVEYTRAVDTLVLARTKYPGAKVNLDALCNRYGIDLSRREKHGALLDAELLADLYLELLGGRQNAMFLSGKEAAASSEKPLFNKGKKLRERRKFPASEEERKAHREFLEKNKIPVW